MNLHVSIILVCSLNVDRDKHKDQCACTAQEFLVQLSTNTQDFKKYSGGVTKYMRVTHSFKLSCTIGTVTGPR